MDKALARKIKTEIENTLAKNGIPGCQISIKGGTIWPNAVIFKMEVAEIQNGQVMSTDATEFIEHAGLANNFKAEDLGKKVFVNSEEYELIGAKWYTKYPILMKRISNGKTYRFPSSTVLAALGRPLIAGFAGTR